MTHDEIERLMKQAVAGNYVIGRHRVEAVCRGYLATKEENERLRAALLGAAVDYDHCPYQMATAEIERLKKARIEINGESRGLWYLLDSTAVQDMATARSWDEGEEDNG